MHKAEELFARHHRDVLRYLAHMTGRLDEAEDLAQEVFMKVIRALHDGGAIDHDRGWVFSIARNLLVDRYRDQQRQVPQAGGGEPAIEGRQGVDFDLRQSLGRLASADREIFLLKEIGGFTYEEIAHACACTVESVRARLHRTRIALRSMMSPAASGRNRGH
jgi:RNA polymerase sigma-70 factor (ECF subfamily)